MAVFESVERMPDLIRDILDLALSRAGRTRPFDIEGGNEDMDFAMSSADGEYGLAAINHGQKPADLMIFPLNLAPARPYALTDLRTGKTSGKLGKDLYLLRITVKSGDFCAVKIKAEESPDR
jgi:hypothetical protein